MCKNKRLIAVLLGLVMIMSLSGCSLTEMFVTDTGSGGQGEIPREDYLKTEVLGRQEGQTVEDLYTVLTLSKSKFEDPALNQILRQSFLNVPTVNYTLDGITAQFGEYVAEYGDWVEVGDVIATVYTEVDDIALEEAKTKLQRLEERYQAAEVQMTEDLQQIADDKHYCYDAHKAWIYDVQYRQRQMDWEYQKANYESQIKEAKEELNKMTQVGAVYEVEATMEGLIIFERRQRAGDEMQEGDYICHILNSTEIYTSTDDQADQFHYGMEVIFDNLNGQTPATVVNGGSWILYGNLDTGSTIFCLEFEQDVSELDRNGLNNLILKGNLKEMDNVIVIPKSAVTVEEEQYYVTVLKEDGSLIKTEFIPGGSNVESYWVLEGLTEGMKIVY